MRNPRLIRVVFVVTVLIPFFGVRSAQPVHASVQAQDFCAVSTRWDEEEMGNFVLVFPEDFSDFSEELVQNFSAELNKLLEDYRMVFYTEPSVPITLRIYPTHNDFYCLNPKIGYLGESPEHSHSGTREIALFMEIFNGDSGEWYPAVINGIRHELAVLFAGNITEEFAPPGLLFGIGGYFENPAEYSSVRFEASRNTQTANLTWKQLWDESVQLSDQSAFLQTTSTVAYLIDVYGWEAFIDFLKEIKLQQGYHPALTKIYGHRLPDLEEQWVSYYRLYLDHRWQHNIFYEYDLGVITTMLTSGAYQDSVSRLNEAVFLIGIFGEGEDLASAQDLLERAKLGVEAGERARQARDALFSGNYKDSYISANLALEFYDQLGDSRRVTEIEAYRAAAKEVLDLRAGLDAIREKGIGLNPLRSNEILSIGQRLLALGDSEGGKQVSILLSLLGIQQNTFFQLLISLVILICTGLIIRQAVASRKPTPPEADLL